LLSAARLPLLGLEPDGGEPLMSVTRGQCDTRPMVTLPAAKNHRHWLVPIILLSDRGTCVLTTCPGLHWKRGGQDSIPRLADLKFNILTTRPPGHTNVGSVQKYYFSEVVIIP